jgi:hypothetical protein
LSSVGDDSEVLVSLHGAVLDAGDEGLFDFKLVVFGHDCVLRRDPFNEKTLWQAGASNPTEKAGLNGSPEGSLLN